MTPNVVMLGLLVVSSALGLVCALWWLLAPVLVANAYLAVRVLRDEMTAFERM